jgi:hypothetical protein
MAKSNKAQNRSSMNQKSNSGLHARKQESASESGPSKPKSGSQSSIRNADNSSRQKKER